MTDFEVWNAFGSDSSSDDDDDILINRNQNNVNDVSHANTKNPGRGSQAQQQQQPGRTDDDDGNDLVSCLVSATLDATLLRITSQFLRLSNLSGVPLRDRVVGVGVDDDFIIGDAREDDDDKQRKKRKHYEMMVAEKVRGRGMKVLDPGHQDDTSCRGCDAAIVLRNNARSRYFGKNEDLSCIQRALLPGGSLWMILLLLATDEGEDYNNGGQGKQYNVTTEKDCDAGDDRMQIELAREFPTSIWSMAVVPSSSTTVMQRSAHNFQVVHLQKHACAINAWSCPWMNKAQQQQQQHLISIYNETEEYFPIMDGESENYMQYERRLASALTVVPSAKERCHRKSTYCGGTNNTASSGEEEFATILTEKHVQQASELLQRHGLVIIKGLLSPSQTVPWGEAVLSDFQSAVSRLKCHPTRPVELLNPQSTTSNTVAFEPLSYKEMAMREDLRVDLRSGPEMEKLRKVENGVYELAVRSMIVTKESLLLLDPAPQELGANNIGPTVIHADVMGSVDSWRFHPSILAIIKKVFNPRKETYSQGNFGRWNFGGSGPDGTPQPFRLGQIGSVISCPGSADQAIHADTPHLFEHEDCLPCHYLNVFTPGYQVVDEANNDDDCVKHEFCNGIWTGNSTMGGTAFVYGSHKLSVSAQLLSEEEDGAGWKDVKKGSMENGAAGSASASMRKKMLWLRTLRPSLEAGDVLMFDCRTIHFGLANTSRGDPSGRNASAGRRPMLYTNVTQSWFHDPKNWDDREKIFE